jgi:hypothetical protein
MEESPRVTDRDGIGSMRDAHEIVVWVVATM